MEAAKAALSFEKPRLAAVEMKEVDEFENMSPGELSQFLYQDAIEGGIPEEYARRYAGLEPQGEVDWPDSKPRPGKPWLVKSR